MDTLLFKISERAITRVYQHGTTVKNKKKTPWVIREEF